MSMLIVGSWQIGNNNWFPGVSEMQGYEWAFAPFVQMDRDFLMDIIFQLFLYQSCSCLRQGVDKFCWGRYIWLQDE
jgi:hypothetical protein